MRTILRHPVFLVVVVAAAVYAGALTNGFVFDDHQIIEENPLVTDPGHVGEIFESHYWHPLRSRGYLYRPLTVLSYRADYIINSGPAGFHLTNLLLHAATTALVFLVLNLLYRPRETLPHVPLVASLLFATHPIHSEAVVGIAGRGDLLATLFVLTAWLLHIKGYPWLTGVAFLAGTLCKESAVVLPGILLASDLCLRSVPRDSKKILKLYGPTVAGLVVYLMLRGLVLGSLVGADPSLITELDNPLVTQAASVRIATAIKVMAVECFLFVIPWSLSADYSFNQITVVRGMSDPIFLSGLVLIAAASSFAWLFRKRRSGPTFPILFFVVCIAPVANIVLPVGTVMAERILYLPSLGACLGLALAFGFLSRGNARGALTIGILVAALFALRTTARVPEWKNDLSLFTSAARTAPRSAKAHYNLGMVHLREGDAAAALPHLQRAVSITHGLMNTTNMMSDLGVAFTRLGRIDEAIAVLEKARVLDPRRGPVLLNLGNAYVQRGEHRRALEAYDAALESHPGYSGARMNRARLLVRLGRSQEAVRDLETVVRETPAQSDLARAAREMLDKIDSR